MNSAGTPSCLGVQVLKTVVGGRRGLGENKDNTRVVLTGNWGEEYSK